PPTRFASLWRLVATLALGCLYLSAALFCAWLLKNNFNFFGFAFNPANKKVYFIFDLICIPLCIVAISEQVHWLLIVLFLMHVLNSGGMLLYSNYFYESENEIRELGEATLIYSVIGILSIAGIFCIYTAYL
ncbi:MAG: hypothetical protein P8O01_05580, partial [SAR86 cluster bacterium]|nr:hypothetical protein [SAR86 cluster bacterium]